MTSVVRAPDVAMRNRILVGDVRQQLALLPDHFVDQVVTSPPYFRLRDYHVSGQLGLEHHVDLWVEHQRQVAAEIARVLVPTGTYWLNLGDSYSTHPTQGAGKKSLLLGPERLGIALIKDGWIIRNKLVWQKPNPMPSSVKDRLNTAWEVIYVLARQPAHFFDLDAIREPHKSRQGTADPSPLRRRVREDWRGPNGDDASGLAYLKARGLVGHVLGKNPGDVWTIANAGYRAPGGTTHHATFPLRLVDRIVRAGSPEARCQACLLPWKRTIERSLGTLAVRGQLRPTCICETIREPGLVLDPFLGSGTTAVSARSLGRDWLGIELNPAFAATAAARLETSIPERSHGP